MEIGNVTVLDGTVSGDFHDCVILDADTAQQALDRGELVQMVDAALRALYLAGKSVVYVKASE